MPIIDKKTILTLLRELIAIPSVNPSLSPEEGHDEVKIAEYIVQWLKRYQIDAHIEYVADGRPNVYAEIGNGIGPSLCLCAHMDTVGTTGMEIEPFEPKVEGNQIYGRGSCDMKAGIAAIMSTAATLSMEGDINGTLVLALVCDEEYKSMGTEYFTKHHKADACILTEPSDLKMVVAHKGFLWGKWTTYGKSAHGSRWDIGESAISKMGKVITVLDDLDQNVLRNREVDLLGPASMHISLINGGLGVSTYAPECVLHLERRTLPNEKLADVKKEIERKVYQIDNHAKAEWYFHRAPFSCSHEELIVQTVAQAYETLTERKPDIVGWGFWTDAAIFQDAGIPTVNIGAIGSGLHEAVEWVNADSVVKNTDILIDATKNYLAK